MPPKAAAASSSTTAKPKKTKSSGSRGAKKKLTPFNKFMQTEMARLKETEPDITHQERFKKATANWKTAPENPKPSS
ncbi:hypothetical protein BDZ89DRAFT_1069353 [Hymenopellis radicata]|nr:hypothetical protein BDZ89DRAFT_1069353 [Hymenopellis radicata]